MLIHDYVAYKIWENDQYERELKLSRLRTGLSIKKTPLRTGWWGTIALKLVALLM